MRNISGRNSEAGLQQAPQKKISFRTVPMLGVTQTEYLGSIHGIFCPPLRPDRHYCVPPFSSLMGTGGPFFWNKAAGRESVPAASFSAHLREVYI